MSSSTKTPTVAATVDDATKPPWVNPTNSTACDTTNLATCALDATGAGIYSEMLKLTHFDFAIPSGTVIDGIKVEVKGSCATATSVELYSAYLVIDNTIQDVRRYESTKWTNTLTFYAAGGASDLWGESLTYSDINSDTFGVAVLVKNSKGSAVTANIDCVQVTVYYTAITVDLGVELDADNLNPTTGEYVEVMVDVVNNGDYTATGSHVHITIPAGLTYISDSCVNGRFDDNTGVWTMGDMVSGQNTSLYLILDVTTDGSHQVDAEVDNDITDSEASNDSDSITITSSTPTPNTTYGFTFKNQHSSEYGIDFIDYPERNLRAPTNDTLSDVPGRDGELPLRQDDKSKTLKIGFKVFGTSPSNLRTLLYSIAQWFRTEKVRNNVPVTDELVFDDEQDKKWIGYFTGEVTDKPYINMAECSATYIVPSGTANNILTNTSPATGTNNGSVTIPCKVYVTAESESNMIVANSQTGQAIYIVRDFSEGEEIEIDTDKRIVTSNGRDIRSYVAFDSSFFKIQPGAFEITTSNGSIRKVELEERYY